MNLDEETSKLLIDVAVLDPDLSVRYAATRRLRKIVNDNDAAWQTARSFLRDQSQPEDIRHLALEAVLASNRPEALDAVREYLRQEQRPEHLGFIKKYYPDRARQLSANPP